MKVESPSPWCCRKECEKPGGVARSGGRGFLTGVGIRVGTGPIVSPPERGGKSEGCSWMGRKDVEKEPAEIQTKSTSQ